KGSALRWIDIKPDDSYAGFAQACGERSAHQAKADHADRRGRSHLLRLDAGGLASLAPAHDLAADEIAEFRRRLRGDDDAEVGEMLLGLGQFEKLFAFGIDLVDDRVRRPGG